MAVITLPRARTRNANLAQPVGADGTASGSGSTRSGGSINLYDKGLKVGDVVSASAELLSPSASPAERTRLVLRFNDYGGSQISAVTSSYADNASFTRHTIEGATIPAGTKQIQLLSERESGTGTHYIRRTMINLGDTILPYVPAHSGPSFAGVNFGMMRADEVLEFASGAQQITAFSKAVWTVSWSMPILPPEELRQWRAVLAQLSTFANTFELVPPECRGGPSTGYAGENPLVKGAGQLGTTLAVDGMSASTLILNPGDYFSITVNGQRELHMVTEPLYSDGSGEGTITFTPSLRNAPDDNATVEIYAPRCAFRLLKPECGWDLDMMLRGQVSVQAVEYFTP